MSGHRAIVGRQPRVRRLLEVPEVFMVAVGSGGDSIDVRTDALDCPDDGTSFHFEDGPMPLVAEDGAAEELNWADGLIRLGQLESDTEPLANSVAAESEIT